MRGCAASKSRAASRASVVTKSGVAESLDQKWLRLPLASDCVRRYEAKVEGMKDNLDAVRGFVEGLDVDE